MARDGRSCATNDIAFEPFLSWKALEISFPGLSLAFVAGCVDVAVPSSLDTTANQNPAYVRPAIENEANTMSTTANLSMQKQVGSNNCTRERSQLCQSASTETWKACTRS